MLSSDMGLQNVVEKLIEESGEVNRKKVGGVNCGDNPVGWVGIALSPLWNVSIGCQVHG